MSTKNIWVISDTHFNHANILTFKSDKGVPVRGQFSSVEEMNETMIERWNEVVKPGDKIYHLGDVLFGPDKKDWLNKNMPRLAGKKRLIFGNHDEPTNFVGTKHFSKTALWRLFKEFNIMLTHVPVHYTTLIEGRCGSDEPMLNVHGHIHQNKAPSRWHHCVCVEQTDYRPVNIEDLAVIARNL